MTDIMLISGGTLIDGTGADPKPNTGIAVAGNQIIALGDEATNLVNDPTTKEVTELNAAGKTIMPGLIDSHLHCSFDDVQSNDELFFHRDPTLVALVAAQNLRKMLRAGVTSFVDPDTSHGIGPALRDAVNAGVVQGPRIKTGVQALLTAVGGTAGRLIPDEGTVGYAQIVNNKDEIVQWVRRHIKYGADWIKLHATGSVPGRSGELLVWNREEIKAACQTAHELSVPVMAHCRGAQSVQVCAEEGVDLILHASFMDDDGLEAVISNGSSICPTFTFLANLADFGSKVHASPGMEDIFRGEIEQTAKMIRKAYDNGFGFFQVRKRLCFNTIRALAWSRVGDLCEFFRFISLEAITTATKNGAWAMQMEDQLGTIEQDKLADIIIVDSDPTEDITVLNNKSEISTVIANGEVLNLSELWPSREQLAGWKVGNWASEILTWDKAYR
ncbi:MAG: dipeptidase [Acidimicrobiaceae bacterium]|nr:MAG: dipeptidase [Acidimicrobiaceae bacterium]